MTNPPMPCSQCGGDIWLEHETPLILIGAKWDNEQQDWVGFIGSKDEGPGAKAVDAFECIKCRQIIFFTADGLEKGD